MRTLVVVSDKVGVQVGLRLLNALVELLAAHDAEVLVEQGPVQAFHEAVGLRAPNPRRAVFGSCGDSLFNRYIYSQTVSHPASSAMTDAENKRRECFRIQEVPVGGSG